MAWTQLHGPGPGLGAQNRDQGPGTWVRSRQAASYCGDQQLQVFGFKCVLILRIQMFKLFQEGGVVHLLSCTQTPSLYARSSAGLRVWTTGASRWPRPLTLNVGAVQFGLEQHPEARNLLTLQLIQACPHVVTHQVQFFSQMSVLNTKTRRDPLITDGCNSTNCKHP